MVNKLRKKKLDTLGQENRKNSVIEDRGHQYIGKQVTKEGIRHTGTRGEKEHEVGIQEVTGSLVKRLRKKELDTLGQEVRKNMRLEYRRSLVH